MAATMMEMYLLNASNLTEQHRRWLHLLQAHPSLFDKSSEYDDDYYGDYNYLPDVHIAAKVVLAAIFILVFLICGFGNALLCLTIFRLKRLRTVTNLFIASLAISDAFVALFCAPFSLYYYLVQDWIFGQTMCTVAATSKMVSLYVSVNTLLAIAVERYYVIFHPLKPRLQKGAVLVISIMIWIVSFIIAIPTPMYSKVGSGYDRYFNLVRYCAEYWSRRTAAQSYMVLLAVFEYVMPMFLMTFGYLCIVRKVWFRQTPGYVSQQQRDLVADPRKKTIRMLVTVVVSFGVCWGPYHAYNLALHFDDNILVQQHNNMTTFYVVESIAMVNGIVNTVVFYMLNETYRKESWAMLRAFVGLNNHLKRRGLGSLAGIRTSARRGSSISSKSSKSTRM